MAMTVSWPLFEKCPFDGEKCQPSVGKTGSAARRTVAWNLGVGPSGHCRAFAEASYVIVRFCDDLIRSLSLEQDVSHVLVSLQHPGPSTVHSH